MRPSLLLGNMDPPSIGSRLSASLLNLQLTNSCCATLRHSGQCPHLPSDLWQGPVFLSPAGGHGNVPVSHIQAGNSTASDASKDDREPQTPSPEVCVPISEPAPHAGHHLLGLLLNRVCLSIDTVEVAPAHVHRDRAGRGWDPGLAELACHFCHGLAGLGCLHMETVFQGCQASTKRALKGVGGLAPLFSRHQGIQPALPRRPLLRSGFQILSTPGP